MVICAWIEPYCRLLSLSLLWLHVWTNNNKIFILFPLVLSGPLCTGGVDPSATCVDDDFPPRPMRGEERVSLSHPLLSPSAAPSVRFVLVLGRPSGLSLALPETAHVEGERERGKIVFAGWLTGKEGDLVCVSLALAWMWACLFDHHRRQSLSFG